MRSRSLAIAVLATSASPAIAQQGTAYVAIEGGASFARRTGYEVAATRIETVPTGNGLLGQTVTTTDTLYRNGFRVRQKTGVDADAIAGYDLGMLRLEIEAGYKRARARTRASDILVADSNTPPISGVTSADFGSNRHTTMLSAMANALVDHDLSPRLRVYGGGGVGAARVRTLGDRDTNFAFQAIAGASTGITRNLGLGVKYRYFQSGRLTFHGDTSFADTTTGATSVSRLEERGRFRSNSVLLSLTYNFRAAP